jgi:hypothetical protein
MKKLTHNTFVDVISKDGKLVPVIVHVPDENVIVQEPGTQEYWIEYVGQLPWEPDSGSMRWMLGGEDGEKLGFCTVGTLVSVYPNPDVVPYLKGSIPIDELNEALPYTFDLLWDLKTKGQLLKEVISLGERLAAIRTAMADNNITFGYAATQENTNAASL